MAYLLREEMDLRHLRPLELHRGEQAGRRRQEKLAGHLDVWKDKDVLQILLGVEQLCQVLLPS